MFPEPESMSIRDRESTEHQAETSGTHGPKASGEGSDGATPPAGRLQQELRISAALRAAHQDDDAGAWRPSEAPQWTWIVKALPRPPLVATWMDDVVSDELLDNDSLGG